MLTVIFYLIVYDNLDFTKTRERNKFLEMQEFYTDVTLQLNHNP